MSNRRATFLLSLSILAAAAGCAGTSRPVTTTTPDLHSALASVARGERSLFELADRSRGVAYVLRRDDASGEDPRADAEGTVAITTRVCDATDPVLDAVTRALAEHFRPEFDYVPLVCDGLVCTATGPMEYATSLRFEFVRSGADTVLDTIYEVEEVALEDEYARARWSEAFTASASLPPSCDSTARP